MAKLDNVLKTIFSPQGGRPKGLTKFDDKQVGYESSSQYSWLNDALKLDYERHIRYQDYEEMDESSVLVSTSLDTYADDATPYDTRKKKTIWVTSKDKKAQKTLDELFERIELEDLVYTHLRDLAKFGELIKFLPSKGIKSGAKQDDQAPSDSKQEKKGDDDKKDTSFAGIYSMEEVPSAEVEPVYEYGKLTGFKVRQGKEKEYEPWEFFYTRLRTKQRTSYALGGTVISTPLSMIESARRNWKILRVMETAMAISRVTKSPGIRTFYIDTTGLSANEARVLTEWYRRRYKRNIYINQGGHQFDVTLNLTSIADDIFWPTTKESASRIDVSGANADVRAIEDIKYFREQLIMSLKVPPEYLGVDRGGGGMFDRQLSQKDVKFARAIRKLQRSYLQGVTTLCMIELALHGMSPEDVEFEVHMGTISYLEELQKVEVLNQAVAMVGNLTKIGDSLGISKTPEWLSYIVDVVVSFLGDSIGMAELKNLRQTVLANIDNIPDAADRADSGTKGGAHDDDIIGDLSGGTPEEVADRKFMLLESALGHKLASELASRIFLPAGSLTATMSSRDPLIRLKLPAGEGYDNTERRVEIQQRDDKKSE